MTPLGAYLRQARADRGLSQKQMAADIGISAAYLSALEHGRRGVPSFAMLQRIIGSLHIIWDEAEHVHHLAKMSDPKVTVDTVALSAEATELANRMAADIHKLSADDCRALIVRLDQLAGNGGQVK